MKDGTTQTFVTQSILDSAALQGAPADINTGRGGHYGNPNYNEPTVAAPVNTFSNGIEAYAFVNIYAQDDASHIANITFRELPGSTQAFESDNHTSIVDLINTGDQTGSEIPLPRHGAVAWRRHRADRLDTASPAGLTRPRHSLRTLSISLSNRSSDSRTSAVRATSAGRGQLSSRLPIAFAISRSHSRSSVVSVSCSRSFSAMLMAGVSVCRPRGLHPS
jgi:hypothetical protein